jgi:fermentation-respiration switch protein FrsA (DUF1100 family)
VAVGLAVEQPPAALVLRSPFTSMADVARAHFGFLPPSFEPPDVYPSLGRIGRISAPLLVIAGSADSIVPPAQSVRLYEAAPEPKRLLMVDGAGHNDYVMLAGEQVIDAVAAFVDEYAGGRPPG